MEAAGIEPASRDISVGASTCVVELFPRFARATPGRQGAAQASRERFLAPGVPDSDPGRFGIGNRLLGLSDEDPQSGLPVVRQPEQNYLRQLKILVSFLRGLLTNHGTPPTLLAIRSNPVRPRMPLVWRLATTILPRNWPLVKVDAWPVGAVG